MGGTTGMVHWTERTFEDKADAFAHVLEDKFGEASEEVGSLLSTLEREHDLRPDSVLDVGCGIGRHTVAFAEHGCRVDGIDISERYLERARRRADDAGVDDRVDLHEYDMRELDEWDGSYDLITVFFDTLGYYGKETDREVLRSLYDLLSDRGVLVVELSNKDASIGSLWESQAKKFGDVYRLQRLDYDVTTGVLTSRLDFFEIERAGYEFIDTVTLEIRLYSPAEFGELCRNTGFEDVSLFDDFDGSAVSMANSLFVAVASP